MYEALVKRLRELPAESFTFEIMGAMHEAADAIEELMKAKDKLSEKVAHWEAEVVKSDCDAWLAENADAMKWIPVTERLPEPGWYLVRCNEMHKHIHRIAYYCDSIWYEDGNNITKFVTHWVRLPEPPKEGE